MIDAGQKGTLLTLVERQTLCTIIVRLEGKHSEDLAREAMTPLKDKIHTNTFDNGMAFTDHEVIAKGLDADIYFAPRLCFLGARYQ